MFESIERNERLSDKVAHALLESVLSERMAPGTRLPSERELGEQFQVSRTVIREAVRHLVAKGVLEVRSGSGVCVARVDAASVSESIRLFMRSQGLEYGLINEVRVVLESHIARLAGERADDDDIAALRACYDRLDAAGASGGASAVEDIAVTDVEFHRLIAQATHNPLYTLLLDSIGALLLEIRRATVGIPGRPALARPHHRNILERIADHDPEGAEAAMRAHLQEADEAWRGLAAP
jgi:GntR family transcriptional regulator, transcriptional repressor for pyruvate dehydrogenase complex